MKLTDDHYELRVRDSVIGFKLSGRYKVITDTLILLGGTAEDDYDKKGTKNSITERNSQFLTQAIVRTKYLIRPDSLIQLNYPSKIAVKTWTFVKS